MSIKNSKDFYRKNWPLLKKLLQVDKTYCIHHGFYEKGIRTHIHAVLNMNDFIGRLLELDKKENRIKQVLDAGCGIGGTIIYLAKKHPAIHFTGITNIPEHVEIAKKLAKENFVVSNTDFFSRDFMETGFPSDSFDAVFSIESVSYAPQKRVLIREMYRILKSGRELVVIDGFRTSIQLNLFLRNIYIWFCKGWGIPNLIAIEEFKASLQTEGFDRIIDRDLTKNVIRTLLRGVILSIPYIFSTIIKKIIKGKKYQIEDDPDFPAAVSILSIIIGIKKGITYNAVSAIKK